MKKTLACSLLFAAAAANAHADEPPRFQLAGAAGWNLGSSSDAVHLTVRPSFALDKHFLIGADVAYSYLPLAREARGGGNRAYWALATLTADALPSSRVSPYLTLGFGLGVFDSSYAASDVGKAAALGAGLQVRLSPRASLFVESRVSLMGATNGADGLHGELPVRIGVSVGF